MDNFIYHNPTKIIFGNESLSNLPELLPKEKILFLYGSKSILENGTHNKISKLLYDFEITEAPGVTPNPDFDFALEVVKTMNEKNIKFILAVGGGSVIDCAKFISIAVNYNGDPVNLLNEDEADKVSPIPFATISTLPATGSEMNSGSVMSYKGSKVGVFNSRNYPVFSILDPSLTLSLPKHYIGNGVVDAYIHVLEQYLTYPQSAPLQDRFSESILKTLIEVGPKTYSEPTNIEYRSSMSWCTTMALNNLIGCGVKSDWSTHALGHQLTSIYGIDHARTLALVWSKNMRLRKENKMEKMLQYGQRVFGITESDPDKAFELILKATDDFFESLGVPTSFTAYSEVGNDLAFKMMSRLKALKLNTLGEKDDLNIMKIMQIFKL
tara:strand:- start:550 stop:1695 length:1146 start_codon:yes stop_codon:yes gene_type:complete